METNYTDLTLHKVENSSKGQNVIPVNDYKELFQAGNQAGRWKRKTVILSGDPGIGKTTICKKVAWDWATGLFTTFTIVFLVSMQLIKPGDTMENIIMQQTPKLEGLGISEKKLKNLLDNFGKRCLIMFDGYDEFVAKNKNNADLIRIFQGRKFLHCNLLLTSRPHAVTNIKKYFQYDVRVQGFSKKNARLFASRVLKEPLHADLVMEIQCISVGDLQNCGDLLHASPMLLLFVCILANNKEIDLTQKTTPLGEITSDCSDGFTKST